MNLKEIQKNTAAAGGRLSGTGKYENLAVSLIGLSEDITENFNFKKINSLSTQPLAAQLLAQEGIDIVTL